MGSGGERTRSGNWKPSPNKPNDKRFMGKPGEKKTVYNRKGEKIETKIGKYGRATIERHYSDHHNPKSHTNPHDHKIDWSKGYPSPGKPINYPDGAPEFKNFWRNYIMDKGVNIENLDDSLNFTSINEFKLCMKSGGEIEFYWKGKTYCAFGKVQRTPHSKVQMYISGVDSPETEKYYDNVDDLLEYAVQGEKLESIITNIKVIDRTI